MEDYLARMLLTGDLRRDETLDRLKRQNKRETSKQVNENFRGIQKFGNERYVNRHNFVPIHGFNKIQNGGVAI